MTKIRNLLIGIAAVCLVIGSMLLLPWGKDAQKVYAAEAPVVSVRGDLNADGVVNLDDVIILRQYLAGMIELTDKQMEAGDVYGGDAEITLDDVIVMRQYLAGIQVEGGVGEPMEHVHTIVYHEGKPATCTEAGWEPYETCTECDYTTYQEIAPLGHDLVEFEAKPATCIEAGWDAYVTCTRCDYTTYQEIAPLSHNLIEHEAKPATCTEAGWDAYVTCTRCDYTTYQEIAAKGHQYSEHVCVVCGENEPTEGLIYELSLDKSCYSVVGYEGAKTEVHIPSIYNGLPVTGIGDNAFWSCSNLTSVTMPKSVMSIGKNAFYMCRGLTGDLLIPEGVISIGEYAFNSCNSLTGKLSIPTSVTSIEDYAFLGCNSLTSIVVEEDNSAYYSAGNCLIERETGTLLKGCNNSVIPGGIVSIGKMKERNITQYRLFKLSGVAQTTIGDIRLQRNKSVSLLILHELSQGLGISLYDFFDCPLFKGNDITD